MQHFIKNFIQSLHHKIQQKDLREKFSMNQTTNNFESLKDRFYFNVLMVILLLYVVPVYIICKLVYPSMSIGMMILPLVVCLLHLYIWWNLWENDGEIAIYLFQLFGLIYVHSIINK